MRKRPGKAARITRRISAAIRLANAITPGDDATRRTLADTLSNLRADGYRIESDVKLRYIAHIVS